VKVSLYVDKFRMFRIFLKHSMCLHLSILYLMIPLNEQVLMKSGVEVRSVMILY
jgi:hypothetical protein